jgi:hypothetical protein
MWWGLAPLLRACRDNKMMNSNNFSDKQSQVTRELCVHFNGSLNFINTQAQAK